MTEVRIVGSFGERWWMERGMGGSLGCSSCYDSFVGLIIQVFIHSVIVH